MVLMPRNEQDRVFHIRGSWTTTLERSSAATTRSSSLLSTQRLRPRCNPVIVKTSHSSRLRSTTTASPDSATPRAAPRSLIATTSTLPKVSAGSTAGTAASTRSHASTSRERPGPALFDNQLAVANHMRVGIDGSLVRLEVLEVDKGAVGNAILVIMSAG